MGKNAKENLLDAKLIQVYEQYGLQTFMNTCAEMLNIRDKQDWEKKKKVNGEVCEVLLKVMTEDYLKRRVQCGRTFHSMILTDLDKPQSDFCTELDFTLLTPGFCVTGECKSFVGEVRATGECTLTRDKLRADVSRQSKLHARCLKRYLEEVTKPGINRAAPPYGVFCFVFSNGVLVDLRDDKYRSAIPILTVSTLYPYYDSLFRDFSKEVFDYTKACGVFEHAATSAELHKRHKAYNHY